MNQNSYESDEIVAQYLEFHYGQKYFGVENYPKTCAEHCLNLMKGQSQNKALDLGCAVGRTTFELALNFKQVVGVDLSYSFIHCAKQLNKKKSINYHNIIEGELSTQSKVSLSELQLDENLGKVNFYQEDACALGKQHKNYDLIFAGNLLDRLAYPQEFLNNIHKYLNIGGILVIIAAILMFI